MSSGAAAKIEDASKAKTTGNTAAALKKETRDGDEVIILSCILSPWVRAMSDSRLNGHTAGKQFQTIDGHCGKTEVTEELYHVRWDRY